MNLDDLQKNFEAQHDLLVKMLKISKEQVFIAILQLLMYGYMFYKVWNEDDLAVLIFLGIMMWAFAFISGLHMRKLTKKRDALEEELKKLEEEFTNQP